MVSPAVYFAAGEQGEGAYEDKDKFCSICLNRLCRRRLMQEVFIMGQGLEWQL